jgi:hypothetical protein
LTGSGGLLGGLTGVLGLTHHTGPFGGIFGPLIRELHVIEQVLLNDLHSLQQAVTHAISGSGIAAAAAATPGADLLGGLLGGLTGSGGLLGGLTGSGGLLGGLIGSGGLLGGLTGVLGLTHHTGPFGGIFGPLIRELHLILQVLQTFARAGLLVA